MADSWITDITHFLDEEGELISSPSKRKPCREEIVGFVDPKTDDIVWMCSKCGDRGLISNWRETIRDMSEVEVAQ